MSRNTVADYMRDAVEQAGGRISEDAYLTAVQTMMNADGREQKLESLKTNAFNKKNMDKAEITRLTIGTGRTAVKLVVIQEDADSILDGGVVVSHAAPHTTQVAPENMGTTDGGVWFGIPRRSEDYYSPEAEVMIPQNTTGFIESDNREMWRLSTAYRMGKHTLMEGAKGTGKTIAVKEICAQLQMPMWRITCSEGLSTDDLIGYMTSDGVQTQFIDGHVTAAVRHGGILFLDEFNFAKPSVCSILHMIMDSGHLVIPMTGEVLKAHADFRIFAALNPCEDYAGTEETNQATIDRFGVSLPFDYLDAEKEIPCIMAQSGNNNRTLARQLVAYANDLRTMKKDRTISTDTSTRTLIDVMELATEWNVTDSIEFSMIPKYQPHERDQVRMAGRQRMGDYQTVTTPTDD